MSEEREEVYQILELGKHEKNLHHKKGFGGLLFIDLSMIKFSKLSSYIRQLDKENQELKKQLYDASIQIQELIEKLQQENKQLKVQLLVAQTNEETFRLEMEDITKILDLDENTLFDDVKAYVRSLKDNWNELKEYLINDINNRNGNRVVEYKKVGKVVEYENSGEVSETISPIYTLMEDKSKTMKEVLDKMQELERSDSNE